MFAVSETHFSLGVPHERPEIDGYNSWFNERGPGDKQGGGLALYYAKNLHAHCYTPAVVQEHSYLNSERQWLLLESSQHKIAFLSCYLACVSTLGDFRSWNRDLYSMMTAEVIKLRSLGFLVLCLGDFNARVGVLPGLEDNDPSENANTTVHHVYHLRQVTEPSYPPHSPCASRPLHPLHGERRLPTQ